MKKSSWPVVLFLHNSTNSFLSLRQDLLMALLAKGSKVYVALPKIDQAPDLKAWLMSKDIEIVNFYLDRLGKNPIRELWTIFNLFRLLRRISPDVLVLTTIKPVIYGSIAACLNSFKTRITVVAIITGLGRSFSSGLSLSERMTKTIINVLYAFVLRFPRLIYFQNVESQKAFYDLKILPQNRQTVVLPGSGVCTKRFRASSIPKSSCQFLMIARLLRSKGVVEFVEAAKQLSLLHNVEFVLAGPFESGVGAFTQRELMTALESSPVRYIGALTNVKEALDKCSAFILPSYYPEGVPKIILEALAIGRPIITSDMPGCKETVVPGRNGFLVPPKNANALANAMNKIAQMDDIKRQQFGDYSRTLAVSKFRVELVTEKIIADLNECSQFW